ncbi:MAG TPA: hypothetical protein VFW44_13270 [Bryobacteraceae bacterium]|nr:hypothetical protein [Bryobacteraceae bacterium]
MPLPRMLPVRQHFPDHSLRDVRGEVLRQLAERDFASRPKPGGRIGIGVGSRGIANIATITRATVDYWKSQGFRPFIFPAMGSHGGATPEGQADVLAHYGIHEATMECPVDSSIDVVSTGQTPEGIDTFLARSAFESDGVMVVGRVKWHTDFSGKLESGLSKMTAIGLGKLAGAQRYHVYGYKLGLEHVIRTVGRQIIASGKILGGLAILEDANHNTGHVQAVPADQMESTDEELLVKVRGWMGRLPFPLDVLIVDEIGKNISGSGMDSKVVNRSVHGDSNPWKDEPRIERIFIRDLSPHTYGNAMGVGMADVVHDRLLAKIDWPATLLNSLTANTPTEVRTPIHFPSDRECLERISTVVGHVDLTKVTYGWIKNSMELAFLWLSENLKGKIAENPALEIVGPAEELEADDAGNFPGFRVVESPAGVLIH